jgi:hypothetical protein
MYADLVLYTEPKRPLINPKYDLFAWLNKDRIPVIFPAKVVDTVSLTLPEKCKEAIVIPDDIWDFILWQVEEKGYTVVREIDTNWFYWAVLANKVQLLKAKYQ